MPVPISSVKVSDLSGSSRRKNQEAIAEVLRKDPLSAFSIKELQEVASVKYTAATLIAVNALERKGLVEKFINESDNLTYVHWIGDEETRVLVTKSKEFVDTK